MLESVKRQVAAIGRIPSSRGFGIQSPWAYHLMTDVIARRSPDSECLAIEAAHTVTEIRRREFCRLMYRLARRISPVLYASVRPDPLCRSYIKIASHNTAVKLWRECGEADMAEPMMLHADIHDAEALQMAASASGESLLVVGGIRSDGSGMRLWKELRDSPLTGVTFDLYDHALLFFGHKRPKQHYRGPCF